MSGIAQYEMIEAIKDNQSQEEIRQVIPKTDPSLAIH